MIRRPLITGESFATALILGIVVSGLYGWWILFTVLVTIVSTLLAVAAGLIVAAIKFGSHLQMHP